MTSKSRSLKDSKPLSKAGCIVNGGDDEMLRIGTSKHLPSSTSLSSSQKPKRIVVVKKRRELKRQGLRVDLRPPPKRAGLPSLRPGVVDQTLAQERRLQQVQQPPGGEDTDIFALDTEQESFFQSLPSDTLMVIQTLQEDSQTCLAIPLLHGCSVRGVLECQIQQRLSLNQNASIELHEAMGKDLVQLQIASSPSQQKDGLQVLLLVADYKIGVEDALERRKQQLQDDEKEAALTSAAQWMLQHIPDLSKNRITKRDLLEVYEDDPPVPVSGKRKRQSLPLTELLDMLQQLQVILPSHHSDSFQLWLPEWGTVLKAWQKAQTYLLAQIKRSYHKERSVSALHAPYSPIPTPVLVEWLLAQGIVQEIQRPSGKFLKITC